MDYKYIEQLLERYWACETSLQEEEILRAFFHQQEVPAHLEMYRSLFTVQQEHAEGGLGKDFDQCMLHLVGESADTDDAVRAGRISLYRRMRPLYQAAGLVAFVLVIGMAAQRSFEAPAEDLASSYAVVDSLASPDNQFTPIPERQSASLPAEQIDSMNIRR